MIRCEIGKSNKEWDKAKREKGKEWFVRIDSGEKKEEEEEEREREEKEKSDDEEEEEEVIIEGETKWWWMKELWEKGWAADRKKAIGNVCVGGK